MTLALPLDTPVGRLDDDSEFFFRRTVRFGRDQCGWVRTRSVVDTDTESEPLVNGVDRRGRIRTVRLSEITRIKRKTSRR